MLLEHWRFPILALHGVDYVTDGTTAEQSVDVVDLALVVLHVKFR